MAMNSSSMTVSAELGLRLVVPDRTTVPLLARLEYSADDPYAIRTAFYVGNDEPVEWIFARDLLTVGIVRKVGDGDVQVWPASQDSERVLNLALSSPFGDALFEAPLTPLADFLHRTYEIVPAGQESEFVDMQAELENLLWPS
jgi:Streptomyces sporulation and cell division protein, SsgA